MSNRRSPWIDRRGQRDAAIAIEQVLERQLLVGEQVQQLADELIEDSPYQARRSFSLESVEELAQGMRQAGFQGVLIVRPHGDPARRRGGVVQLVYGHRRRIAWRQVCRERSLPCLMPVVVREIDDTQLLTIGAQENLQRQDLDPLEEAQIVAWHERMFFDKNQAEIGAMLGKSSDWVSTRSRIHKLPDALKQRLRQRPRAIKQVLELATLYQRQPQIAVELADRVVNEQLTVEVVRAIINSQADTQEVHGARDEKNNRRAGATSVPDVTISESTLGAPAQGIASRLPDAAAAEFSRSPVGAPARSSVHPVSPSERLVDQRDDTTPSTDTEHALDTSLTRLEEAAAVLTSLAAHADDVPGQVAATKAIAMAEQALDVLRRALLTRTIAATAWPRQRAYRLLEADMCEVLARLWQRGAISVRLCAWEGRSTDLQLVLCLLPSASSDRQQRDSNAARLFVAVLGGNHAIFSLHTDGAFDQVQLTLRLARSQAVILEAFLSDVMRVYLATT